MNLSMLAAPRHRKADAARPPGAHAPARTAAADDVGIQGDRMKREAPRRDPAAGKWMAIAPRPGGPPVRKAEVPFPI
jgi:hypothetical protein